MKIELGIGIRDLGIEIDIGIEACFGAKSHLFGVCGHSMALSLQGRVVFRSIPCGHLFWFNLFRHHVHASYCCLSWRRSWKQDGRQSP